MHLLTSTFTEIKALRYREDHRVLPVHFFVFLVLVQAVIIYALLHRTNIVIFTDIKCNIFRVTRAREEIVEQKALKAHLAIVLCR